MARTSYDVGDLSADLSGRLSELNALTAASDKFGSVLSTGLKQAIISGKSLDAVLKQMALRLSGNALEAALKPLTSLLGNLASSLTGSFGTTLSSLVGSVFGFAKGGIVPFADGGVVATPTYFPLSGNRTGVMGEAGSEAILPLARGADGSLGVRGGGGVNVTFNVSTPDARSFRRSEAQMTAMLARAVGRGRRGL